MTIVGDASRSTFSKSQKVVYHVRNNIWVLHSYRVFCRRHVKMAFRGIVTWENFLKFFSERTVEWYLLHHWFFIEYFEFNFSLACNSGDPVREFYIDRLFQFFAKDFQSHILKRPLRRIHRGSRPCNAPPIYGSPS